MAWTTPNNFANADIITEAKLDTFTTSITELQTTVGLSASATINPGAITNATTYVSDAITVTGASVGDTVIVGAPAAIDTGLLWNGYVSAADTVKVRIGNITAAPITPASATWKVRVLPANP